MLCLPRFFLTDSAASAKESEKVRLSSKLYQRMSHHLISQCSVWSGSRPRISLQKRIKYVVDSKHLTLESLCKES